MVETVYRLPEICKTTGLSRSSIYQLMGEGRFPRPVQIGRRSVGWLATEIELWLLNRISERNERNQKTQP